MIVRFTFRYSTKLTAEQLGALNQIVIPEIVPGDDGIVETWREYDGDLTRVLAILGPDASVEVRGLGDPRPILALQEQMGALMRRFDSIASDASTYVNQKVDVHVPGNALLAVDEVEVLYDQCTDSLQQELDAGWRILAICPQPDQRRPDYVVGRRKGLDALR